MTLVISKGITLRKGWQPMDPDAAAYITAVETADAEPLEEKTKIAIDNFVLGCKADGIWPAIKASCILAGARTLEGALVPLTGAAPTNFNFVAGDYNRKTGLVGNGSTKYLDSNRLSNADPQNNFHAAVYASTVATGSGTHLGAVDTTPSINRAVQIAVQNAQDYLTARSNVNFAGSGDRKTGLLGVIRPSSSILIARWDNTTNSLSSTSAVPVERNILVFGQNVNGSPGTYGNGRLAFYSIGESLDLALLDARVTDLINAFAAAIP